MILPLYIYKLHNESTIYLRRSTSHYVLRVPVSHFYKHNKHGREWKAVFSLYPPLLLYLELRDWDVDYDDDNAHDDGDDAEQTSQPTQPPGPVNVPHL